MIRFAGYASVFDHPDSGNDIVRKGAFAGAPARGLPVLRQHDPRLRIGTVDDVVEDDRGLRVIATLANGQTAQRGDGLSFGYRVLKSAQGTYRELLEVELLEISLVRQPMQSRARIIAVEHLAQGD